MPLTPNALASDLESNWLVAEGGEHPASAAASGDAFAAAVAGWFGGATAGPYPCATAAARRAQLAAAATAALQAGAPTVAGSQLAIALMTYMAGQVFGPGVASPPTAVAVAQSAIVAVFSNLELSLSARAATLAAGAHGLAMSTIVVFPPVISPPVPVL